ncbi:hypothetical protein DICPUDRAFT_84323 [Dictyostelium purpureum]|uniref:Uncharacterized protein n=1 Tax=Dictyostelium purpureum TaxID=5786 RepID=F1A2A8_DICPU|nr:uncharacterized protein DICPUDRAFT_84323 [Dictyostelium purpureum]EGC29665.1 hypothetical protein DICPUDRAFT_84323 [Dictyostelium purpureum]|eukprot:XP_003293798.1 hypothetical protein DICPUDRAFT_84323 [Dictyostelium purpureum]
MDYQVLGDDLNDQDDINDSSDEENLYDTSRFDPIEPFSFIVENKIQTEFLEFFDSDNLYEETFKIGKNKRTDSILDLYLAYDLLDDRRTRKMKNNFMSFPRD